MATMNRYFYNYSERYAAAHLNECEWGVSFVYSSIDKHKRGNCIVDTVQQL